MDRGRASGAVRSEQASSLRRRRASARFGLKPLLALGIATVAVACGSVSGEPFGIGDAVPDASTAATATATATTTATVPVTTADAASSSPDAATFPDAGSSPLLDCPTDYAHLETFLNTSPCGNCAGAKCTLLAADCFQDCACIQGALAVFQCTEVATNILSCTALAVNLPPRYESETFDCAMQCESTCVAHANSDSGAPITDSGSSVADSGHDASR